MGKCGAFFSTGMRLFLYGVALVGTAATLYGIVSSQSQNKSCWLGGSTCLLFGSMENNATRCGVSQLHLATGGKVATCNYVTFYSAAQAVAVVGLCVLSIMVARGRKDGHNTESWRRGAKFCELVTVMLLTVCSLAAALLLSIGLAVLCHNLTRDWRYEPSNLAYGNGTGPSGHHMGHKFHGCSSTYVAQDIAVKFNASGHGNYSSTFSKVKFHHYYYVAQIAAWASFLVWLIHLPISIAAFRRRPVADELPYTLRPSDSLTSLDDDLLT